MMGKVLHNKHLLILLLCSLAVILYACAHQPLLQLPARNTLTLLDDGFEEREALRAAVQKSLHYLSAKPPDASFTVNNHPLLIARLTKTLHFFLQLLEESSSSQELSQKIKQHFILYQAAGTSGYNPGRNMLVTGYYQPVFKGSLKRDPPYLYPLYAVPDNIVVKRGHNHHITDIGRFKDDEFIPYWTRKDIEEQKKAAGHELVYLQDPLDAYLLHIQGSGIIALDNGTKRTVQYALKNGRQYRSIGKYMVDTGRMTLAEASIKNIRRYFEDHPEDIKEILYHNDSFIFFKWGNHIESVGNLGLELTAGRSIAADQEIFPAGGLAFLRSRQPVVKDNRVISWKTLQRFVLIQDKGSAIKGPGRVDFFWGRGDKAAMTAGRMKEPGQLYFLLLKDNHPELNKQ